MKNFKLLSRAEMRNLAGGNTCQPNQYTCGDGTCIDLYLYMDGVADCLDGSDEDLGGDSPKVAACRGKKKDDKCSYMYQGGPVYACCDAYAASELFCSTLNTSCF